MSAASVSHSRYLIRRRGRGRRAVWRVYDFGGFWVGNRRSFADAVGLVDADIRQWLHPRRITAARAGDGRGRVSTTAVPA